MNSLDRSITLGLFLTLVMFATAPVLVEGSNRDTATSPEGLVLRNMNNDKRVIIPIGKKLKVKLDGDRVKGVLTSCDTGGFVLKLKEREDSILHTEVLNIRVQATTFGRVAGYTIQTYGVLVATVGMVITSAFGNGGLDDYLPLAYGVGLVALGDRIRGKRYRIGEKWVFESGSEL